MRFLDAGISVSEADNLDGAKKGLRSGYGQTKWVSERLVMKARTRGVPATIVRPGYIVGDSKTGGTRFIFVKYYFIFCIYNSKLPLVMNTDDFLLRLIKGCVQLGQVPRIANVVNMCPVDYVANAVSEIVAREKSFEEGVFHMWNPHQ